jgi:hypothetical protein
MDPNNYDHNIPLLHKQFSKLSLNETVKPPERERPYSFGKLADRASSGDNPFSYPPRRGGYVGKKTKINKRKSTKKSKTNKKRFTKRKY